MITLEIWWIKGLFRGWKKGLKVAPRDSIPRQVELQVYSFCMLVDRKILCLQETTLLQIDFYIYSKIHTQGYKFKNYYYISEKKRKERKIK